LLIGPETEIDFGFICYGKDATDLNISCHIELPEKNEERALFDLQTLGFLALKNATLMVGRREK